MKMVMMIMIGGVVFLASAAGGWFLKAGGAKPVEEKPDDEVVDITADPIDALANEQVKDASDMMPVAVREDAMSVEELLRFSLSLKERERVLRGNEEQFHQRQVQQQLVLADVKAEQQTIDGLRSQLSDHLAAGQNMIAELNSIRDNVIKEREKTKEEFREIESQQIDITEQHKVNNKKVSTFLQGMSAEKSAAVLKEMANDGQMDVAVQLLANIEERDAAKILDSLEDPRILNEFIAAFRNLKNEKNKKAADGGRGTTR